MKSRALVFGVVCLMTLLSLSVFSYSQDKTMQLYAIGEVVVHPSKYLDFEAAMKDWVAFYMAHKYPWPFATYRTEDFCYYFLMPMKSMADFDEMIKADVELAKKGGQEFESLMKKYSSSYAFYNMGTLYLRYDLSYMPEQPRVKIEDAAFIYWDYYYIIPGKERDAEEIAKEWQALFKGNNIPDGFQVWMVAMAYDLPLIVASRWGKSEADFNAENEKNLMKLGDAYSALAKKTMDLCRKYERKTGYRILELSYTPEAK